MIDLHTHTTESDGTLTPAELLNEAQALGLEALAITDHDTLAGYDAARLLGPETDLVCGIELSTKYRSRSVHLLGYFFRDDPGPEFRAWLDQMQASRRDRNRRLIARLNELGLGITLDEVEAIGGRLTGRPHFARVLVEKGYVPNYQQAFDEYLDESARGYVYREEPSLAEAIRQIGEAGGLPVLAHPTRLQFPLDKELPLLVETGLGGIEVWHSDHTPEQTEAFLKLAGSHRLAVTGGSDFHGEAKPQVRLGTGIGRNLSIPMRVLKRLRELQFRLPVRTPHPA